MDQHEYMTVKEITAEFGIHPSKIAKWIKEGDLPFTQSKRDMRIKYILRSDIEQFLGPETPTTTPKPATMGASLEGDAPGQAPKRDRSTNFLDDVRPLSQMTNDELRARKATQPDYNLTADTINAYVASGTGEVTEDERFRIENDLPS